MNISPFKYKNEFFSGDLEKLQCRIYISHFSYNKPLISCFIFAINLISLSVCSI